MANKNKTIKTNANEVLTAWSNLAKDDTFAGMTLQQFTQMVDAVDSHQTGMNNLRAQYTGAAKQRDDLHVTLNETTLAVVDAVKADLAKHGPDSALYKTMGYVPKSERSSGLTRKTIVTVSPGETTTGTTTNTTASMPTAVTSGSA